jgi:hypothetical protein
MFKFFKKKKPKRVKKIRIDFVKMVGKESMEVDIYYCDEYKDTMIITTRDSLNFKVSL